MRHQISSLKPTRYEVAFVGLNGHQAVLGYIARKSAIGMLEFIQHSQLAQAIVSNMPNDVMVERKSKGWDVTHHGSYYGRFCFTGNTEREAANATR